MKRFFHLFLLLSLASSCGPHSTTDSLSSQHSATVNGLPAEQYYNQFIYKTTHQNDITYFHFLSSLDTDIKTADGETLIKVSVEISMASNHTYEAYYYEKRWVRDVPDGYAFDDYFRKKIHGAWSVSPQGELILAGLGRAQGVKIDERPGLMMTYTDDINLKGLRDQIVQVHFVSSSASPEDEWLHLHKDGPNQ